MRYSRYVLVVLLSILLLSSGCRTDRKREVLFSYSKILKQEYRYDMGKSIPLTIEQSVETDGIFSREGLYFYYSSNRERGNYDIYLRSLTDITTVRLTAHPSKDIRPAISPDGRYLAFVSLREDPEGDIYSVEVDPSGMIKSAETSVTAIPAIDSAAKNLTQVIDPATKSVKIIKDDHPVWSPDSRRIAFSSSRDGLENIWITDRSGKNPRQVTKRGGKYPAFSPDGEKIIYVSYRDGKSNGDVYIVDIDTGLEKRITKTSFIEMSPSFIRSGFEIVYTLFDRDTNGDGRIDLRDSSILYYRNLNTGEQYPLTLYSVSSFAPRWVPLYGGVLIYSEESENNINIKIIPDTGIIPLKENARRQYEFAQQYLREYDDPERYLLCLERVYDFFGRRADTESRIFTSKALADAVLYHSKLGNKRESGRLMKILVSRGNENRPYERLMGIFLKARISGRSGEMILQNGIRDVMKKEAGKDIVPYIIEDLADEKKRRGKKDEAITAYKSILKQYPGYRRSVHVHYKIGTLTYTKPSAVLSPSLVYVLNSAGFVYLKNDTVMHIMGLYNGIENRSVRINLIMNMIDSYHKDRNILNLLNYLAGMTHYQIGNYPEAKKRLGISLKNSRKTDLMYYKSNVLMGAIAERQRKRVEMEKHYSSAAINYLLVWRQKDMRLIVKKLIDYYEEYGERAVYSGNFGEAVSLYKKYVFLITKLYGKKGFQDIYDNYGSRAHVLYIDAYAETAGGGIKQLRELEEEYSERKKLNVARLSFDKAYIYSFGYIHARLALALEKSTWHDERSKIKNMLVAFRKSLEQLEWALFIDDTYIDPYVLKGWIYQHVDLRRKEDEKTGKGRKQRLFDSFFPRYLWEENLTIYRKALETNDESINPDKEGDLHLNAANTYYLLSLFSRARIHYEAVARYKQGFGSRIEEALYHYHLGYCYWQENKFAQSRGEMNKALFIYRTLASNKKVNLYKYQIFYLYRFFAMLSRIEKDYVSAIDWYNSTLDFARLHRISLDSARYLQEIAWCYNQLGDDETALLYLERSSALLKGQESRERKHRFKIWAFGIGPFRLFNLGADGAVYGENRIYSELDVFEKKLLNISMKESIHVKRHNYIQSINLLKRKINILKKRPCRVTRETSLRTLNNIGYCYFRLGDYSNARDYFQRAWDYAGDKEVNDLEGMFNAIINIANLYAFLAENDLIGKMPADDEADILIGKIKSYRTDYKNRRYKNELAMLKKEAKRTKKEISPERITALKRQIDDDASNIFYALDRALGVLCFYKAERMANQKRVEEGIGNVDLAFDTYRHYQDIYEYYSNALKRFESAMKRAESAASSKLQVKLMLNTAICYDRLGDAERAYEMYNDAEKTVNDYEYTDLKWNVYYSIAGFLQRSGAQVEGSRALNLAGQYYKKSIREVEGIPQNIVNSIERVKRLYNDYAAFLISSGRNREALDICERMYATLRIMLISSLSPNFPAGRHGDDYNNINVIRERIYELRNRLSGMLEKGQKREYPVVRNVINGIEGETERMDKIVGSIRLYSPLIASYVAVEPGSLSVKPGIVAVRFFSSGDTVYCWRISNMDTQFFRCGKLSDSGFSSRLVSRIRPSSGERLFIVLDEHSQMVMNTPTLISAGLSFSYVPSIDRIQHYAAPPEGSLDSIYYTGEGLKSQLQSLPDYGSVLISEGGTGEDLSLYSVYVDNEKGNIIQGARLLFRGSIKPVVVLKNSTEMTLNEMYQLIESSLYAGTASLVLYSGIDKNAAGQLVRSLFEGTVATVPVKAIGNGRAVIAIGFPGSFTGKKGEGAVLNAGRMFEGFRIEMSNHNFLKAGRYLEKWRELQEKTPHVEARYWLERAYLELGGEDFSAASLSAEKAFKAAGINNPKERIGALLTRVYLLAYRGRTKDGRSLLNGVGKASAPADYTILNEIFNVLEGRSYSAERVRAQFENTRETFLPRSRLVLMWAEALYLAGEENEARADMKYFVHDTSLSDREMCKAALIGNVLPLNEGRSRVQAIVGLKDSSDDGDSLRKEVLELSHVNGQYDSISIYPLIFAINRFKDSSRFDQIKLLMSMVDHANIMKHALWVDALFLSDILIKIYNAHEENEKALDIASIAVDKSPVDVSAAKKRFHHEQAFTQVLLERYAGAYAALKDGMAHLRTRDSELAVQYELLAAECEISLGKFGESYKRLVSLEKMNLENQYRYVVYFLKVRHILAQVLMANRATGPELMTAEQNVKKGLEVLDRDPGTIQLYNRTDLVLQGLDFSISFRMSRRKFVDALIMAELKKQIRLRSYFTSPLLHKIPDDIREEFKNIRNADTGKNRFAELLGSYPSLYLSALPETIPVGMFQKKISDRFVIFYMVRNGKDIFAWVITGQFIQPVRFRNAYPDSVSAVREYGEALRSFRNTFGVSRKLYGIFKSLEKYYREREVVIFCTDSDLQNIPFEIMGEKTMLEESHAVVFLSSILSTFIRYPGPSVGVTLIDTEKRDTSHYLEWTALGQSGIAFRKGNRIEGGSGHVFPALYYDPLRRELTLGGSLFGKRIGSADTLFLRGVDARGIIGYNDLALVGSLFKIKKVIVNDVEIRDVNCAIFIDTYYRVLLKKNSVLSAFEKAKTSVRTKVRFRYPAYWAGIRLYVNGM